MSLRSFQSARCTDRQNQFSQEIFQYRKYFSRTINDSGHLQNFSITLPFRIKFNTMKKAILFIGLFFALSVFQACGPVIVSHRLADPPPPWFYPNRIEAVRYVFFPEFNIYYDLNTRVYIYLDGGVWVRRNVLPPRYRSYNLNRSRYERVRNYYDDNIERYHNQNNSNRGRSNKSGVRRNN